VDNEIRELTVLIDKNMKKCPWIKNQTSKTHLKKLFSELEELDDAYNKSNWNGTQEEMGDVLWDVLILAYILEKEGRINVKQTIRNIREKICRRKPWLESNDEISLDEAKRIWIEKKNME